MTVYELLLVDEKRTDTESLGKFIALQEDNFMSIDNTNDIFRLVFCKSVFYFIFLISLFIVFYKHPSLQQIAFFFFSWLFFR